MISFEKILQVINETGDEFIKKVERNQRKTTFYIPITEGVIIGEIVEDPRWEANLKCMYDGRVIIYTTPSGGRIEFKEELMRYMDI